MVQQLTPARGTRGVYAIVRIATGESYIGSSSNIRARLNSHRSALRRGVHKTPRLQAAWTEFGEAAFTYVLIERVDNLSMLGEREQWWLDESETFIPGVGYNRSPGATGAGWQYTAAQRARLSEAHRGLVRSDSHRAALSARMRNLDPETLQGYRDRMAAVGRSGKGVPKSADHLRKIGEAQQGSLNHSAKLTEPQVVEIRTRLAAGEKGRHLALEFGVHESIVSEIKTGRRWRHIL